MGAVSQFAVELALTSCTSEGGCWYSYSVLVGRGQRKVTGTHAKRVRRDQKKVASYIQYFSRQQAKQEVACNPIY